MIENTIEKLAPDFTYQSETKLSGWSAKAHGGPGIIIVTNLLSNKQYVGTSFYNSRTRINTILHTGNMPEAMVEDRKKYRTRDDHEVWLIEFVPVPYPPGFNPNDKQQCRDFEEHLKDIKHDIIVELGCLFPKGYNRTSGRLFCQESKVLISIGINNMIEEKSKADGHIQTEGNGTGS